ncbi:unnamed protein product [Rhizoctonia solani]|uniref:F-box domain-containing protein n=1 Tax=Rhizoctonia solani TaxID=456999 RepID=A0A8H3HT54_9AGAM|nr:unnamed protein product [Rhizoctonia solani]
MHFIALPLETITNILGQARPIDIRRCQLVCRHLRQLVTSSSYLQYILELDSCGYTVPLISRSDLSYEEMIKMLREHREAWQDPSSRSTEFIKILPRERVNSYIADGVFTYGHTDKKDQLEHNPTIDEIHFHRLRSTNKGTGYEHWHHHDFGFPIEAFAIQPEIDLLVLVEGTVLKEQIERHHMIGMMTRVYKSYRLHFQTISANTPHVLSSSTFLDTGLGGVSSIKEPIGTQLTVSLNGRMIMLVGSTNHSTTERTIGVWDWVEGTEILRISVPTYPLHNHQSIPCCHAYLLSEEYLAVFRFDDEASPPTNSQDTKLGHFDTYQLRAQPGARWFTRFELPSSSVPEVEREVTMLYRSAGLPWTPDWLSKLQYAPRIYETAPQNRLFCLFLTIWTIQRSNTGAVLDRRPYHPLVHVPVQALLSHLGAKYDNHPTVIPWSDWGRQVCWVDTSSWAYPPVTHSDVSGLRHSIRDFHYYTLSDNQTIKPARDMQAILDFDPQRIKLTRAIEIRPGGSNNQASHSEFMAHLNTSSNRKRIFETPVNLVTPYIHTSLNLRPLPPDDAFLTSCLIDDEHILILVKGHKDEMNHLVPLVAFHAYTL